MLLTKSFSLGAVLSATTGYLMCDFNEVQELAEHLAGEAVWTHQMPGLSGPMEAALLRQNKWLPTREVYEQRANKDKTGEQNASEFLSYCLNIGWPSTIEVQGNTITEQERFAACLSTLELMRRAFGGSK